MAGTKLEELILYIAKKMNEEGHADVGRLKLAKLLFRIDFEAYARHGQAVTGADYRADRLGPVPVEELTATLDLEAQHRFEWESGGAHARPLALDDPYMEEFKPWEKRLADELLTKYASVPAHVMVDEAHSFAGWIHAWDDGRGKGARVPYEAIFWDDARTSASAWENAYARDLAERHGL